MGISTVADWQTGRALSVHGKPETIPLGPQRRKQGKAEEAEPLYCRSVIW